MSGFVTVDLFTIVSLALALALTWIRELNDVPNKRNASKTKR